MSINDRIGEFADSLDISRRKFYKKNGMSDGALRSKSMSSDLLARILKNYPQLNMKWVLFGEGEMLLKTGQIATEAGTSTSQGSIDKMIDAKIDERMDEIKRTLGHLVINEIQKEIDRAASSKEAVDKTEG